VATVSVKYRINGVESPVGSCISNYVASFFCCEFTPPDPADPAPYFLNLRVINLFILYVVF